MCKECLSVGKCVLQSLLYISQFQLAKLAQLHNPIHMASWPEMSNHFLLYTYSPKKTLIMTKMSVSLKCNNYINKNSKKTKITL